MHTHTQKHCMQQLTYSHKTIHLIQHKQFKPNLSSVPRCGILGNEKDHRIWFCYALKRPPALPTGLYLTYFQWGVFLQASSDSVDFLMLNSTKYYSSKAVTSFVTLACRMFSWVVLGTAEILLISAAELILIDSSGYTLLCRIPAKVSSPM